MLDLSNAAVALHAQKLVMGRMRRELLRLRMESDVRGIAFVYREAEILARARDRIQRFLGDGDKPFDLYPAHPRHVFGWKTYERGVRHMSDYMLDRTSGKKRDVVLAFFEAYAIREARDAIRRIDEHAPLDATGAVPTSNALIEFTYGTFGRRSTTAAAAAADDDDEVADDDGRYKKMPQPPPLPRPPFAPGGIPVRYEDEAAARHTRGGGGAPLAKAKTAASHLTHLLMRGVTADSRTASELRLEADRMRHELVDALDALRAKLLEVEKRRGAAADDAEPAPLVVALLELVSFVYTTYVYTSPPPPPKSSEKRTEAAAMSLGLGGPTGKEEPLSAAATAVVEAHAAGRTASPGQTETLREETLAAEVERTRAAREQARRDARGARVAAVAGSATIGGMFYLDAALYVVYKAVRFAMQVVALSWATSAFRSRYVAQVYGRRRQDPPPPLMHMLFAFLSIDATLQLLLVAAVFTCRFMYKAYDNAFIVDDALVMLVVREYVLQSVFVLAIGAVLAHYMWLKRYFEYKTQGLATVSAYRSMLLGVCGAAAIVPFGVVIS